MIVAKVVISRLRRVIPSLISRNQSVFVQNRQILYGVLVNNEIVDLAKRSRIDCLLLKVDFEKAYDGVSLNYLVSVMRR